MKVLKIIAEIAICFGWLCSVGTCGSLEQDYISFSQGIGQLAKGIALMMGGYLTLRIIRIYAYMKYKKGKKRREESKKLQRVQRQ